MYCLCVAFGNKFFSFYFILFYCLSVAFDNKL
jgi:hypothetical protein